MTSPKAPKASPTRKPSGTIHSVYHECPKPSAMMTARMAVVDMTDFDAAHTHSANTTSSSEIGALVIASQVRWTCIRENAEYIASKLDVNIALWHTIPVPMNTMYFMPPI